MTSEASEYFERGEFGEAARRYRKILEEFPSDTVAKSMLEASSPTIVPLDDWMIRPTLAAIASDEIFRPQRLAIGQHDVHARIKPSFRTPLAAIWLLR